MVSFVFEGIISFIELNFFLILFCICFDLVDFLISKIIDILFICVDCIIFFICWMSFWIEGLKNCFIVLIFICSLFFLIDILFFFLSNFFKVLFFMFWYNLFRFVIGIVILIGFVIFGVKLCFVILKFWNIFKNDFG